MPPQSDHRRKSVPKLKHTGRNCFNLFAKFHFHTDYLQTQGYQGYQTIKKTVRNLKIPFARATIHPTLNKIKNHYLKTLKTEKKIINQLIVNVLPPNDNF